MLAVLAVSAGLAIVCIARSRSRQAGSTTAASTAPAAALSVKELQAVIEKLRPLHEKLRRPSPGDWLYYHREPGQTFGQYRRSRPVVPTDERRTIYIQPLGKFTRTQRKIVDLTAEVMGLYFALPVKVEPCLPDAVVPARARRTHPVRGDKQILTTYVLEKVLKPRLPKDAFACIALTASDLWPGHGWNFVFGQASLRERVGVWSIYRFGDPDKSTDDFRRCLLRTIRTAAHEIGHMFSMLHCTAYKCNMCGSNSLAESDRRPAWLCPECLAKLCWATGADPVERYGKLAEFCKVHGLQAEREFYEKSLKALGAAQRPR